ncbi:hypothetical protein JCM19239_2142 [Vibrio variabilis]|uniref:Uncharacterized protein n=1 Tax=Vibrio variabilis TaxID=990271 RepID=A0ABQ0JJI6_9VIBR|nr:hypothetical protein JCM19239_2142 [Vibrio variabilis]
MNFTYYGTNKNDEEMTFFTDSQTISDTRLYYQTSYFQEQRTEVEDVMPEEEDDEFF